ncbi:MAG: LD-carboxypeptidase [Bacteroidales bacterium]|nr:LD-carboxypeptidase [Bacteroidales bacterium]
MKRISPPALKFGDTIGLVAPARHVTQQEMRTAIHFFTSQGFLVKTSPHLFSKHFQLGGTDQERAADFMAMVDDSDVKAIVCARDGYGSVRILEHINLRHLQANPKWVVGNGDITQLHSIICNWYGLEVMHGIMPTEFPVDDHHYDSCLRLVRALLGEAPSYTLPPHPLNRHGTATGQLVGGNLATLSMQIGTDGDVVPQDKILFLEHGHCRPFEIDRLMMHLKRSGKLKAIAGMVVGTFSNFIAEVEPFGRAPYEIIHDVMADYDVPICFGLQSGTGSQNMPLILGRAVQLDVRPEAVQLDFAPAPQNGLIA